MGFISPTEWTYWWARWMKWFWLEFECTSSWWDGWQGIRVCHEQINCPSHSQIWTWYDSFGCRPVKLWPCYEVRLSVIICILVLQYGLLNMHICSKIYPNNWSIRFTSMLFYHVLITQTHSAVSCALLLSAFASQKKLKREGKEKDRLQLSILRSLHL